MGTSTESSCITPAVMVEASCLANSIPPLQLRYSPTENLPLKGALAPRYVTALGDTDTRCGWRGDKPQGGILVDVPSGEIIARGLSMPHSPRAGTTAGCGCSNRGPAD